MPSNRQYLRIEGNAVHLVRESVERTVTLDDLVGEVTRANGITTPILPAGCRMFHQQGDRSVFVIEQAPQVRQLIWLGTDDVGDRWKLAFPFVIFVVVFRGEAVATGECRVFYRTSPLGSGDEKLSRPNLCNTYHDGRVCTGDVRVSGQTLAQKAEAFVTAFWRSRFNRDLADHNFWPMAERLPAVASLTAWQAESDRNPLFPLSVSWLSFEGGSLGDVIAGRC